jgi:hypothetical protein
MKLQLFKSLLAVILLLTTVKLQAQSADAVKTKVQLFEGLLIAGYLDHGAYINCAGPAVKFSKKPFSVLLGLLPGLRIKEDKVPAGSPKNAVVMPSLGFGLTASFKHLALQLPLYYNGKTATKNGAWKPGLGLGYKF